MQFIFRGLDETPLNGLVIAAHRDIMVHFYELILRNNEDILVDT